MLVVTLFAGCGGDDETSPDSLSSRLLPASELPGFKVKRTFEWDKAVDYAVQGVFFSENTKPSELVGVIEDSGFEAGAGQDFAQGAMGPGISVRAVKFASSEGAEDVRDRLHQEDLTQPCYGVCSQIQSAFTVTGIPDALGAQSRPDPVPPANAPPPFEGYAVEFAVGPYLYVVAGGGEPGSLGRERVLDAAAALYQRVKDED
jgi:hypothetical protein